MIAGTLTLHAQQRLQQRAIPPFVIDLLDEFGSTMRCGEAERLSFDKAARRRVTQAFGGRRGLQLIERWLNVYAIMGDDGRLVTVARQTRRSRRV